MKLSAILVAACSALAVCATSLAPAAADMPGEHPYYVHALGDLRYARALIDRDDRRPGADWQQDAAISDIHAAYADIRRAGIDDGKNVDAHRIDPDIDRPGRLRRAMEALQRARADVAREEDDPAAIGLRDAALHDIGRAMEHVHAAIADNRL